VGISAERGAVAGVSFSVVLCLWDYETLLFQKRVSFPAVQGNSNLVKVENAGL